MRRNAHDDFGRGIFRRWKRIGYAMARRRWFVRERDESAVGTEDGACFLEELDGEGVHDVL